MKTIKKNKSNGLGKLQKPKATGFDWVRAMTVLNPDEKIDKGGGFPPAFITTPRGEGKVYAKVITILWHEGSNKYENTNYTDGYALFKAFEAIFKEEIENILNAGRNPKEAYGYTKMKLKVEFTDGRDEEFRADVSPTEFNPYNFKSLHDFVISGSGVGQDDDLQNYIFNFQGFENPNYKKEPNWKPKPEVIAKIKAEEDKNPEGYKFRGSNYNSKLSKSEIAKLVRTKIAEKYPYMVVSVRTQSFAGGSSIDGTIKDFGFNPFTPEFEKHIKEGNDLNSWRDDYNQYKDYYTKEAKKIYDYCKSLLNSYNFDDSDLQSDYFYKNFYGNFTIDFDSLIKLYIPDSKYAIGNKQRQEENKKREEKQKAIRNERKAQFTYKYGDLVTVNVTWRGKGQVQEFALITKVPNGASRMATSYTVDIIRPLSPEKEKEKLEYENKTKTSMYSKNKRNKYIGVTYIDGKPYGYLQEIAGYLQKNLKPYEGNWTHWLKEEQLKEQKAAEAKAKRKLQAETKTAKPTQASKPTSDDVTIRRNKRLKGIEIIFGSFPSEETRNYIKSLGFRWNKNEKLWYSSFSEATLKKVNEKFGQPAEAPAQNKAFIMARAKAKLKLLALNF